MLGAPLYCWAVLAPHVVSRDTVIGWHRYCWAVEGLDSPLGFLWCHPSKERETGFITAGVRVEVQIPQGASMGTLGRRVQGLFADQWRWKPWHPTWPVPTQRVEELVCLDMAS